MQLGPCRSAIWLTAAVASVGLWFAPSVQAQATARTSFDDRLDQLIGDLESPSGEVRSAAAYKLLKIPDWRFTLPRITRLLQAAAKSLPRVAVRDPDLDEVDPESTDIEELDVGAMLVGIVAERARAEHIPIVESCFAKYSADARGEALQLLMWLRSRDAAEATMRLIRKHAGDDGEPIMHLWSWSELPECADVFFPELLSLASTDQNEENILFLLDSFVENPGTSIDVLDGCGPALVDLYRRHEKQLLPAQRAAGKDAFYRKAYISHRRHACKLLELMSHCPTEDGLGELRQAVAFRDPLLKLHAAIALWRLSEGVPANTLRDLAADPETRIELFAHLEVCESLHRFPARYWSQAALAESDFVRWLINDSDKARPPAKIELVKVVTVDPQTDAGLLDFYVFQFCMKPPKPGETPAWKAGVAGPYPRAEQPTAAAHSPPQSAFEAIEEKWPEEHIGDLREVIQEYRWRAGMQD